MNNVAKGHVTLSGFLVGAAVGAAVERTKAAVRHEAQVIANTLESPRH